MGKWSDIRDVKITELSTVEPGSGLVIIWSINVAEVDVTLVGLVTICKRRTKITCQYTQLFADIDHIVGN